MKLAALRWAISCLAGTLLVLHLVFPALQLDAISLALLFVVILPWLSPLIKSAELPGGWKVEFHDVEKAAEKITGPQMDVASTGAAWPVPTPSARAEATNTTMETAIPAPAPNLPDDPNLALVSLRIAIEQRLRTLSMRAGKSGKGSASDLLQGLEGTGLLSRDQLRGLQAVIDAGNKAAHGASVDPSVSQWARTRGLDILETLDAAVRR